jgi:hypothetical protein
LGLMGRLVWDGLGLRSLRETAKGEEGCLLPTMQAAIGNR